MCLQSLQQLKNIALFVMSKVNFHGKMGGHGSKLAVVTRFGWSLQVTRDGPNDSNWTVMYPTNGQKD